MLTIESIPIFEVVGPTRKNGRENRKRWKRCFRPHADDSTKQDGAMVAKVLIRGRDVAGGETEQPGKEGVG